MPDGCGRGIASCAERENWGEENTLNLGLIFLKGLPWMAGSWGSLPVAFPARVALVLAGELGPGARVLPPPSPQPRGIAAGRT